MALEALCGFKSGDYTDEQLKNVLNKISDYAEDNTEFNSLMPVY